MTPQLTLMQIIGQVEPLARSGDVIRLTGTGVARTLYLSSAEGQQTAQPQEVEYENNMTFTGSSTFQEVGRIAMAGQKLEHAFASMGSGYLLGGGSTSRRVAVSMCRSADTQSPVVIWSLIDLDQARFIVITSTFVSKPENTKE